MKLYATIAALALAVCASFAQSRNDIPENPTLNQIIDTKAVYRHIPDGILNAPINLHPVYIKEEDTPAGKLIIERAVSSQFLFDAFWVAGFGWDYKITPGTLTIKARPEFFNPKWASVTDPADWKIERRWIIKAIKADGTSETTTIKQWDTDLVYNWPAGSVLVWIGYTIYPHHITGEFSTNPNAGCGLGISIQGYGGGHQIVNPYTINYR